MAERRSCGHDKLAQTGHCSQRGLNERILQTSVSSAEHPLPGLCQLQDLTKCWQAHILLLGLESASMSPSNLDKAFPASPARTACQNDDLLRNFAICFGGLGDLFQGLLCLAELLAGVLEGCALLPHL